MMKKIIALCTVLLFSGSVMAQEAVVKAKPVAASTPVVEKVKVPVMNVKEIKVVDPKVVDAKKIDDKIVTPKVIKKKSKKQVEKQIEPKKTLIFPVSKKEPNVKIDVSKGLEISGHINTGFGYEYMNSQPAGSLGSYFSQEGMAPLRGDLKNKQNSMFYLGDVMLSLAKSFGDTAKFKAELVFGRMNSYSNSNFSLGQAYAAFNVKKAEILVGHFNAPIGSESPYINENDLPMHSLAYTFLLPSYLTGIKGYYKFNDMFDVSVWAANDLRDTFVMKSHVPAFGTKVGMNVKKLRLEAAGAFSPEVDVEKYGKSTYIADLNAIYSVNKKLTLSAEGTYRYDSAPTGLDANKYYLASGKANYKFSPKWDATAQYSFLRDGQGNGGSAAINGTPAAPTHIWGVGTSATGQQGDMHQVAIGGQYHLTDGAKIQGLYRFDVVNPVDASDGKAHAVVANFAYSF